jgi:hypothetical protein
MSTCVQFLSIPVIFCRTLFFFPFLPTHRVRLVSFEAEVEASGDTSKASIWGQHQLISSPVDASASPSSSVRPRFAADSSPARPRFWGRFRPRFESEAEVAEVDSSEPRIEERGAPASPPRHRDPAAAVGTRKKDPNPTASRLPATPL